MRILILGATGFIGNAIFHSLVSDHDVITGSRTQIEGYEKWKFIDFSKKNNWIEILIDLDIVINAIGIIEGDFEQVQTREPLRLFAECIKKNIRIINISAVGAEKNNPPIAFLKTKKIADDFLLSSQLSKIIYPGIVLGKASLSTKFFAEIATFPVIPIVQTKAPPTVHISQLAKLIKDVVEHFENYPQQVFAISRGESFKKILISIRGKKAVFINIPLFFLKLLFGIFPNAKFGIFNKNMMTMLSSISADDYKPMFEEASVKIRPGELTKSNYIPQIFALLSISFIWLWSGISSLVSWNESYGLMTEIGANHPYSLWLIYLGSFADIILGIIIFWKSKREQILLVQVLFILIYTTILSVLAPQYWLHPFGVLSKNIPLIALIFYLYQSKESGE